MKRAVTLNKIADISEFEFKTFGIPLQKQHTRKKKSQANHGTKNLKHSMEFLSPVVS